MPSRPFCLALLILAAPLVATPAFAAPAAKAAATAMTPDQIAAFNQAVSDFTAGQTAQQAGDNVEAVARYEAALPAIRMAVEVDPAKLDNVNFLANALYADAAAQGALGHMDQVTALYGEAAPHWRKLVEAKPTDMASRNILAGILIQLGNHRFNAGDLDGADPYYQEALILARRSVADNGADNASRNLLLGALVGASQTGADPALRIEMFKLGRAMLSDGTIDDLNKAAVQDMTGAESG